MITVHLPIEQLREAPWNPNTMGAAMMERLNNSLARYGLVQNLVVRNIFPEYFEVLSGNQRLKLLREAGVSLVPCVVVDLCDAEARLLAQALNRVQGEDDLGLKAEMVREILRTLPEAEVTAVLPETSASLNSLSSLGAGDIAQYLTNWERQRPARLRHLQFQLTAAQAQTVEEALTLMMPRVKRSVDESPNARGTALYLLCRDYLKEKAK